MELHKVKVIVMAAAGRRREESQMYHCTMDQIVCDQVACEAFKKQFYQNGFQQKYQSTQRKVHQENSKQLAQTQNT